MDDLDRLADLGLRRLPPTPGPAACACGRPMTRRGTAIVCDPCGVTVVLETSKPATPAPPEVADAAREPSNLVGRYVRLKELGAGGFGSVWLAWDSANGRHVALKFLSNVNDEDLARFRREATLAAGLSHPGIGAVYEICDDPPFIAMQYVHGVSADHYTGKPREAARIVRDAAEAVHAAHEQGIIHRDLKPQNIMVETGGRVYVMDFGLAKRTDVESSISQSGLIIGTPQFMSPEQASGQDLDRRADVYSLGVTLYAMLTGKLPFEGTMMSVLRKIASDDPPPPETDAELRAIVEKAMRKDPEERYPTAKALAEDLDRLLKGEAVEARPASVAYKLRKRVAKNPWAWALAAAVVVTALATGLALTLRSKSFEKGRRAKAAIAEAENALKLWRDERYYPIHDVTPAREKVKAAIAGLEGALKVEPDADDARALLGWARLELGDVDGAIDDLRKACARNPGDGRGLAWLSQALRTKATDLRWEADRQATPGQRRDHMAKSKAQVAEADAALRQSLAGRWVGDEWERSLAEALLRLRDHGEDASMRGASGARGRGEEAAWTHLAEAHRGKDQLQEAALCYRRAVDAAPSSSPIRADAARAVAREAFEASAKGVEIERVTRLFVEAVGQAESAVEVDPDSLRAWAALGDVLLKRARFQHAGGDDPIAVLKRVVEEVAPRMAALAPTSGEGWRLRGYANITLGVHMEYKGAEPVPYFKAAVEEDFARSIELEPAGPEGFYGSAIARYDWGKYLVSFGQDPTPLYREAIERDLKTVAELDPDSADPRRFLGLIRSSWGGYLFYTRHEDPTELLKTAIESDFAKAIEMDPDYADLWRERGSAKIHLHAYLNSRNGASVDLLESAIDDFTKAFEKDQSSAMALEDRANARVSLGLLLEKQGGDPVPCYSAAVEDATRALGLNPKAVDAYSARGRAENYWATHVETRGEDPKEHYRKAVAENFEPAVKIHPKLSTLWKFGGLASADMASWLKWSGSILEAAPQFARADEWFSRALDLNPNDSEAWYYRGFYRIVADRIEEGLRDYQQALKLNPGYYEPIVRPVLDEHRDLLKDPNDF